MDIPDDIDVDLNQICNKKKLKIAEDRSLKRSYGSSGDKEVKNSEYNMVNDNPYGLEAKSELESEHKSQEHRSEEHRSEEHRSEKHRSEEHRSEKHRSEEHRSEKHRSEKHRSSYYEQKGDMISERDMSGERENHRKEYSNHNQERQRNTDYYNIDQEQQYSSGGQYDFNGFVDETALKDKLYADIKEEESVKLTYDEIRSRKEKALRKLDRLSSKGYETTRKFNMMSELEDIEEELRELERQKSLDNTILWCRAGLMFVTKTIENANQNFNPFDFQLDGWSEAVFLNINQYDDVFEELYDKYNIYSKKFGPEIRLVGMLGLSAVMFHGSKMSMQKAEKDIPGFEDVMKNNPELRKMYQEAAAAKTKQEINNKNSGLSGGMFGMINNLAGNNLQQQMQNINVDEMLSGMNTTQYQPQPQPQPQPQLPSQFSQPQPNQQPRKPPTELDISEIKDLSELSS